MMIRSDVGVRARIRWGVATTGQLLQDDDKSGDTLALSADGSTLAVAGNGDRTRASRVGVR
jgi:hypothetical protein